MRALVRQHLTPLVDTVETDVMGNMIGRRKRDELAWRKSPVEMEMMRAVKLALDPDGRMNPGRVL